MQEINSQASDHPTYRTAEEWYNSSSKQALILWAEEHGIDIGQDREQLDADWNERIMGAYADHLRRASA